MKEARNTVPDFSAIISIKNDRDPARSVPNPLFIPLHRVAPDTKNYLAMNQNHLKLNYIFRHSTGNKGMIKLPAVNSSTTTTVITAHIAFFPTPLNNGCKT